VSKPDEQFSTHSEPVWRGRADFIVNADLPEPDRYEQLWCAKRSENTFELCCIPFFLYDVALGDIIETSPRGDRQHVVSRVVSPSGRYVFRAFFERRQYRYRDDVVEALTALGALTEWSSSSLLAVDAEDETLAQRVATMLQGRESHGQLVYETGKTA
jgi:hypothetical protein